MINNKTMKQLKRKDLILEHYIPVIETTVNSYNMGDVSVKVWKPKTMGQLPAYQMLDVLRSFKYDLFVYRDPTKVDAPKERCGVVWVSHNPDVMAWDAQVVLRLDYRNKHIDAYFCSLLMRPFSKEASEYYEQRMGFDVWDRMLLMWDSRQFDKEHGYEPAIKVDFSKSEGYDNYESLYEIVDPVNDIAENITPNPSRL